MRALVVVNPAATSTTPGMRDVLVGALGGELKLDVVETAHRGHARELGAEAAADGMDLVVSVGGDGTVNEVVNGLLENGPAPHLPMLAVIPGGSTNVFSRALGRSRDPVEATAQILASLREGRTRLVSLGTASATGTSTAPVAGIDPAGRRRTPRPPMPRRTPRTGRRRAGSSSRPARLRRRRHRPGRGPARPRPALHRPALRAAGRRHLPARPGPAPAGDDPARAG